MHLRNIIQPNGNFQETFNQVHGEPSDITSDSEIIIEPVTVAEMKNFLRLEGFEDDAESGELLFSSDDNLIEELIISAREGIERWCGISITPHTWSVLITNLAGDIELPRSNGFEFISLKDSNGDDIPPENYKLRGEGFKFLETPQQEKMTIVYSAGYVAGGVPKRLKQAIMRDVAFHYENRNDQPGELAQQAMTLASGFKRVSTWLA